MPKPVIRPGHDAPAAVAAFKAMAPAKKVAMLKRAGLLVSPLSRPKAGQPVRRTARASRA